MIASFVALAPLLAPRKNIKFIDRLFLSKNAHNLICQIIMSLRAIDSLVYDEAGKDWWMWPPCLVFIGIAPFLNTLLHFHTKLLEISSILDEQRLAKQRIQVFSFCCHSFTSLNIVITITLTIVQLSAPVSQRFIFLILEMASFLIFCAYCIISSLFIFSHLLSLLKVFRASKNGSMDPGTLDSKELATIKKIRKIIYACIAFECAGVCLIASTPLLITSLY